MSEKIYISKKILYCGIFIFVMGIGWSIFTGISYRNYRNKSSEQYFNMEQRYKLEYSAVTAELERARLHEAELERTVSDIHARVSELSELNKQSSKSVALIQESNTVIGAVFTEYTRRITELTEQLESISSRSNEH